MTKILTIGFITYGEGAFKYLPEFTESLKAQSYQDFDILVLDNSPMGDERNSNWLKQNLPQAKIIRSNQNLGFAKGANRLITRAQEANAKYFGLINPDTILDELAVAKIVEVLDKHQEITVVSPKILRWDFVNKKKTNIIDTYGLTVHFGFKFVDIGQGEIDNGQYDKEEILGPSGASAWFRLSTLGNIKFDEHFFMYKEDCDLAYQLFLAGKKAMLVSEALIYHDRTVVKEFRSAKGRQGKIWSFYGQHLLIFKYWSKQNFWSQLSIIWREIFMLAYALVFETYLLKEASRAWKTSRQN
jgi:GT2 family glycosyltransferase